MNYDVGWPSCYGEVDTDDPALGVFNKVSHDIAVAAEDAKKNGVSLDDLDAAFSPFAGGGDVGNISDFNRLFYRVGQPES